jgi:hypothetical protein
MSIVLFHKVIDICSQFIDTFKGSPPNRSLRNDIEPNLP